MLSVLFVGMELLLPELWGVLEELFGDALWKMEGKVYKSAELLENAIMLMQEMMVKSWLFRLSKHNL